MSAPGTDRREATLAFAFPGVGVRPCGGERPFFERHRAAMASALEEAGAFAGADLEAALEGEAELTELQGQLFTYAFGVAVARAALADGLAPALMAGHSMGLYSALAAAGTLDFADGLRAVEEAFGVVAEASAGVEASMAVVVGLDQAEVEALLAARPEGDTALLVNSNNDTTKIFAGLRADLEALVAAALAADALKARLLPVTSPYHHPGLLADASARFEASLRRFEWRPARVPIVSSIDRRLLIDGEALIELTARNIATPIDWEAVVGTMVGEGVGLVLECGAGVSLTQNGRLMPEGPRFANVKSARRRLGL